MHCYGARCTKNEHNFEVLCINIRSFLVFIISTLLFIPFQAQAQTVVRETDDGRLMLIEFKGKPPYIRQFISPDNAEMYARYAVMLDQVLVASEPASRFGAPAKNINSSIRLERVSPDEISQFSRFEEVVDYRNIREGRRGPPGKGRSSTR